MLDFLGLLAISIGGTALIVLIRRYFDRSDR